MPSVRLAVALLIPPPAGDEVDGLRRALGDGALGRVPPHITLVPPVNVNEARFDEATAVLRRAAAGRSPLELRLGPVTTFRPRNPVAYLAVGGPGLDDLVALRDAVFLPPLARRVDHDFVPHVTVADELPGDRLEAAEAALSAYTATVRIDRVHLLAEGAARVWAPVADARLSVPAVVGRGGLELELSIAGSADESARHATGAGSPFAVTARRGGLTVGLLEGRLPPAAGSAAAVTHVAVAEEHRRTGVGAHLVAAAASHAAAHGCDRLVTVAPAGGGLHDFLRRVGFDPVGAAPGWFAEGADGVALARRL